jgi:hypothetical protein
MEVAMKPVIRWIVCLGALASASAVMAGNAATPGSESKAALAAMNHTSTWGHPDEYGEFTGMRYYANGDYQNAMKFFLIGAHYADKVSQLSIGLMYLHGQGVQKDPVTAYAWIAIAAERHYPQFVATRDKVWSELDSQQRPQAKALTEQLSAQYGDGVAKPRMARELVDARSEITGAYQGYQNHSVYSYTANQFTGMGPMPTCGSSTVNGSPTTGCNDLYADWRWDPKQYFQARDAAWTGTVTVGALKP